MESGFRGMARYSNALGGTHLKSHKPYLKGAKTKMIAMKSKIN